MRLQDSWMIDSNSVTVLKQQFVSYQNELNTLKREACLFGAHADWPWKGLVLSGATRGGSKRADSVMQHYETLFSWSVISSISDRDRSDRLLKVGRFKGPTARFLEGIYAHIRNVGGLSNMRNHLESMSASEIVNFWQAFWGIGPKYARNIMMDVYDSRFHNGYFALDSRIGRLLPKLGFKAGSKYEEQEVFLSGLAFEIGVECWELDRLLYNRNHQLYEQLSNMKGKA
jgi:hypothetical protein